jgi:hypothetical protein
MGSERRMCVVLVVVLVVVRSGGLMGSERRMCDTSGGEIRGFNGIREEDVWY